MKILYTLIFALIGASFTQTYGAELGAGAGSGAAPANNLKRKHAQLKANYKDAIDTLTEMEEDLDDQTEKNRRLKKRLKTSDAKRAEGDGVITELEQALEQSRAAAEEAGVEADMAIAHITTLQGLLGSNQVAYMTLVSQLSAQRVETQNWKRIAEEQRALRKQKEAELEQLKAMLREQDEQRKKAAESMFS